MAVDPVVQDFIARSMAENNRSLMSEISTLITNSVESIKRSNRPISDVTSGHVTYRTGGQACKQIACVSAKRVENIVDSVALW